MKLKPLVQRKAKPAAAGGRKRATRAISIWVYAAVLAVLVAAAIGAVAVTTSATVAGAREQAQAEIGRRTAELLAARLAERLQREYATLAELARQPRLIGAFESGAREELDAIQAEYVAAFPGALRLLAVSAGMSEPNLALKPPVGYALLEMMRRAEQERKAQPAEVHLPGQETAHVNLLQPVQDEQGAVIGHLVLSYPVAVFQAALKGQWGGRVELRQGGAVLAASGQGEGGAGFRQPIRQSRWQLEYHGAPAGDGAASIADMAVPAALLAGAVLAVLAAFALLRRRLLGDGKTAVRLLQDAAVGRMGTEYPVRVAELDGMVVGLINEVRRLEEHFAAPVRPAAPAPVAAPPPVTPAREPDHGLLVVGEEPVVASVSKAGPVSPPTDGAAIESPPAELESATSDESPTRVEIDPVILRAYDVRGMVGAGLDAAVVRRLGCAIGTRMVAADQQQVVVARDGRLSSPELHEALIEGLLSTGRDVLDIGQVPTPVMNFATFHLGTGAGVMVTGSHNPRDYNGLKVVIGGETLSGQAIQELGKLAAYGPFAQGRGKLSRHDVLPQYLDRIVQDVALHRPMRIVVDCGNGVAGAVAPQVYRAMGCEVEELFCEVDGYFPNHHPDPTIRDNLEALISLVRLQGADLGLAFDGDGDRLGVVDAKGKIIWADRQLMLFAADVLTRHPGADIVFDVKCSSKLAEVITEHAGVPVMWKTGHSLIRSKVAELGAPLGGDMSGHIFFKDRWYGFDDAIYAGARLLELLSMDGRSSTEVFAELPESIGTPEIRIALAEGEPARIMSALEGQLLADFAEARITTIDGIRADFPDGWALVRASNTEPRLVLRFEAADQSALARLQEEMRHRLQMVKPGLMLPF